MKKVQVTKVADDKKVAEACKKQMVVPVAHVDQVNFFQVNGKVLHFPNPTVQSATHQNLWVVQGSNSVKEVQQLIPDILAQLGADSLNDLKKMAENMQRDNARSKKAAPTTVAPVDEDDDDIPALVENFDETAAKK